MAWGRTQLQLHCLNECQSTTYLLTWTFQYLDPYCLCLMTQPVRVLSKHGLQITWDSALWGSSAWKASSFSPSCSWHSRHKIHPGDSRLPGTLVVSEQWGCCPSQSPIPVRAHTLTSVLGDAEIMVSFALVYKSAEPRFSCGQVQLWQFDLHFR